MSVESGSRALRRTTLAVVAGRGEPVAGGPLNQPPVLASAFRAGADAGYARDGNPTWERFEAALGALEGGCAVAFPSGMAAATAVLETLEPGARVLAARSAYAEVRRALAERAARGAIALEYVDARDPAAVVAALPGARMLWLDAISNPMLEVAALDAITPAARATGTRLVVDATLATPILVRPLEHGADLVVHSATKYIGGHSDLLLGAAVAREPAAAKRLRESRALAGAVPGTFEAWLALRGLRTLPLRIERGAASAALLAARLAEHPAVARVRYPGLPGDPAHATAARLLDGFGAIVAFELDGGAERADAACERVELITHASSLGGVETLIERHARWDPGPQTPAGLLRLSVGCEDPDDLWRDLERALGASAGAR